MQVEVEIPRGVQPGQSFTVPTPSGLCSVQVPPGSLPGQKVCFSIGHAIPGKPVLLGTVIAEGAPQSMLGTAGESRREGSEGFRYRTDPLAAEVSSLPLLKGIPVEQAERKVAGIRKGAVLARELPAFPAVRRCRDAIAVVPFVLVCVGILAATGIFASSVRSNAGIHGVNPSTLGAMVVAGAVGGAVSLVAAVVFAVLARMAPGCVVWASLLFSPLLLITGGLALLRFVPILSLICLALGLLSLTCIFCCYTRLIPFTIKVVEMVAGVMQEHPMMLGVSLLGSLMGLAWSFACGLAFAGAYLSHRNEVDAASSGEVYVLCFAAALIFGWGAQVVYNVCHVTYCGVFGRWYHKVEEGVAVSKSLWAALTTSFGSVCLGALLVAALRALEFVIRVARRCAQEDGNVVSCILLLLLECVVSCIGDMLDYFSEWAYVQCAVRGASFVEAGRITYSMMTCANVFFVLQDLLINLVVNLGALFCGILSCAAGAGAGFVLGGSSVAIAGAVVGLGAGLAAGGAAAGILSSGTKTILALWAEDGEPLRRMRPAVHHELEYRICSAMEM